MKYAVRRKAVEKLRSRPARGAWVEMLKRYAIRAISVVAPRKGRVG